MRRARVYPGGHEVDSSGSSEALFQQILEAAPDAIVIANAAGQIVWVNPQTETSFGYARESLLGQSVEILLPEQRRTRHEDHRRAYTAAPRPRPVGASLSAST